MLIANNSKPFENPDSGIFKGTIADVVDLGIVQTNFGPKTKIRIVWVLDKNDSEGKPFRAIRQATASMNEKSALYEIVKGVLGTAPPVPFDSELLLGKSNSLVIVKEIGTDGKTFANIKAILPLTRGDVGPKVPTDFVRSKDKVNRGFQTGAPTTASMNTVSSTPTAQPTVQAQAAPVADVVF